MYFDCCVGSFSIQAFVSSYVFVKKIKNHDVFMPLLLSSIQLWSHEMAFVARCLDICSEVHVHSANLLVIF